MIDSLQSLDAELDLVNVTKRDIIESITIEDVKNFLESLGVTQIDVREDKGYLICPTICHNPIHEAESMKLYWYQNNKIFRCYTECNEAMSIFRLYQKFMEINYNPVTLDEAEDYVKKCLKHIAVIDRKPKSSFDFDLSKYEFSNNVPVLDEYPRSMLNFFTKYYHPAWLRDGITKEAMDKFHIEFCLGQNKITIPHFDINGRLIGIRGRALDNRARRSAIIVEGEKSVLLDDGFYGGLSNAVACCGSTFNKYHIALLTDILGVNEIVVALDKEYVDWKTPKAYKYRDKIETMCRKYKNYASFSYIWDYDNLLEEKDSPYDKGKEVFEYLYKNRVKVR